MSASGRPPDRQAARSAVAVAIVLLTALPVPAALAVRSGNDELDVRIENIEAVEGQLVAAVNRLRVAHGLQPLRAVLPLAHAADAHVRALALAGTFTHDWPDGRPFSRWILAYYSPAGFRRWRAGENLVWTSPELTSADALQGWLASPPHKRVLLDPSWREIGLGAVRAVRAPGVYAGRTVEIAAAEFGARS